MNVHASKAEGHGMLMSFDRRVRLWLICHLMAASGEPLKQLHKGCPLIGRSVSSASLRMQRRTSMRGLELETSAAAILCKEAIVTQCCSHLRTSVFICGSFYAKGGLTAGKRQFDGLEFELVDTFAPATSTSCSVL